MKNSRIIVRGAVRMEMVREILRLKELGLSQRDIHRTLKIARSSIQNYLQICCKEEIGYKEASELGDTELRDRLGIQIRGRKKSREFKQPDFNYISKELSSRKGTTLELLWKEWEETVDISYSYGYFCKIYRDWKKSQKVWQRQEYIGGEKCLVDYTGEKLRYFLASSSEIREVEIFVGVLGASNYIYAEATKSQNLQDFQCSHIRMFEHFGGTPRLVIVDNLKSAVTKADRYEPVVNQTFQQLGDHYQVAILPARAGKPQDKGKVEQAVQLVERQILAPLRKARFASIAEINQAIKPLLANLNDRKMKEYGVTRRQLFLEVDKPNLTTLPEFSFIPQDWKKAKVSLDYHVQVKNHYYSVPYSLCRQEVMIKSTDKLIEIFFENNLIATHLKSDVPYQSSTKSEHMPNHHLVTKSWTKEAFLEWAVAAGSSAFELTNLLLDSNRHEEQAFRSILGLKRLSEKFDKSLFLEACQIALNHKCISQRYVKSTLESLVLQQTKTTLSCDHQNLRGADYFH